VRVVKNTLRTQLRARLAVTIAVASLIGFAPRAGSASTLCAGPSLLELANRPTTAASSCVVGLDDLVLETGYYQNASSVGESEVAEYPNSELRIGVARSVEVDYNAPAQIDVSGNHGKGLFTLSDPGLGVKWQLADRANSAYNLEAEVRPPANAASFPWQPKYSLQLDSTRELYKRLRTSVALGVIGENHTLSTIGVDHFCRFSDGTAGLRSSAGIGVSTSPATLFSVEVNDQSSVAHAIRGQSFGDLSYKQTLAPHLLLDVEGGQTFNTSAGTRPHYIGAGLSFGATKS
jgi:hypothetical protein